MGIVTAFIIPLAICVLEVLEDNNTDKPKNTALATINKVIKAGILP